MLAHRKGVNEFHGDRGRAGSSVQSLRAQERGPEGEREDRPESRQRQWGKGPRGDRAVREKAGEGGDMGEKEGEASGSGTMS